MTAESDVLPARVYWLVAGIAVLLMLLLYWFTTAFNVSGPL